MKVVNKVGAVAGTLGWRGSERLGLRVEVRKEGLSHCDRW